MTELPDDLRELDRKLGSIRFEPRSSLGPELLGRLRRADPSHGQPRPRFPRPLLAAAAVAMAAGVALALARLAPPGVLGPERVTVDRCCYDLDGGGDPDDGVRILAERDARVHRLRLYEDRDRSGDFTPDDLVRFDRGREPAVHSPLGAGMVTIERCCLDFDGGGPEDDGLLVIGVPPDRIVMAAIYERSPRSWPPDRAARPFPLR